MTTKLCRAFVQRNSSSLSSFSNHTNISDAEWITITVSSIIFIFAFIGNTAALIVMFGSRGPVRLTNNKYLANLAGADLLRACFMPFTIVARMKKNFMFGKMICKILPIVQGLSVAVDVFTLVCISIERYLAICRPLLILKLQSVRFANLLNAFILFSIWILGLLIALPNLYMYNLCSLPKPDRFQCKKISPQEFDERVYMIALVAFYFVIPMAVMIVLYTLIIWKIYRNSTAMKMRSTHNSNPSKTRSTSSSPALIPFNKCSQYRSVQSDCNEHKAKQSLNFEKLGRASSHHSSSRSRSGFSDEEQVQNPQLDTSLMKPQLNRTRAISHPITRSIYYQNNNTITKKYFQRISFRNSSAQRSSSTHGGISRMDRHRRKALKLLITLIVEFFVCWTPLFAYHTIGTFNKAFYRSTSTVYVDLILLFSFASASCNPLTYYFMSKRYRSVLYAYLPGCFFSKTQRMYLNQKNQQARHLIKVLRSQQQQNLIEKKRKAQPIIDIHHYPRLRSKTTH